MIRTKALNGCALVLLVVCSVQHVGCVHLRKHLPLPNTDTQLAHIKRQTEENSGTFNRFRRFNRLHVCDTDLDCVGRNRASCCASLPQSSIRFCQPLSKVGNVCNTYSRPHMWSGERLGIHCPCEAGLHCISDSSSSFVSRGTCV